MAICDLVPGPNRATPIKLTQQVDGLAFQPVWGVLHRLHPLHRLFDFATVSTDPEGWYPATARASGLVLPAVSALLTLGCAMPLHTPSRVDWLPGDMWGQGLSKLPKKNSMRSNDFQMPGDIGD